MACRIGITTDLASRKAHWESVHPTLRDWQIMAEPTNRANAQALGGCPRITFYKKANPSKLEPNSRANRFFGKQKQILLKNTPVLTKFGVGCPF